jgi:hypothetical protein
VFTDVDRLAPEERENAAWFWNVLERAPSPVKLLNTRCVCVPLRAAARAEGARDGTISTCIA